MKTDQTKVLIKKMQSVIALILIFIVASVICVQDGKNVFLDARAFTLRASICSSQALPSSFRSITKYLLN